MNVIEAEQRYESVRAMTEALCALTGHVWEVFGTSLSGTPGVSYYTFCKRCGAILHVPAAPKGKRPSLEDALALKEEATADLQRACSADGHKNAKGDDAIVTYKWDPDKGWPFSPKICSRCWMKIGAPIPDAAFDKNGNQIPTLSKRLL